MENPYRYSREFQYDPYYEMTLRRDQLGINSSSGCSNPNMMGPADQSANRYDRTMKFGNIHDRLSDAYTIHDELYSPCDGKKSVYPVLGCAAETPKQEGFGGATANISNTNLMLFIFVVFIFACYVVMSSITELKDDIQKIKYSLRLERPASSI